MSLAQKRALVALVRSCEALGSEVDAGVVARVSGLKPNVAVLALTGLERRQLAVRHERPEAWAPTFSGARDGEVRAGAGAAQRSRGGVPHVRRLNRPAPPGRVSGWVRPRTGTPTGRTKLPAPVPTPRPDRGLTSTQRRALLALAEAGELGVGEVAEASGLKANGAALALQALERRGLVRRQEGEPPLWKITFIGHGLANRLRANEALEPRIARPGERGDPA
jgi:DNA-binding MarR family transcriptional regulator